jgi:hypothetical protein
VQALGGSLVRKLGQHALVTPFCSEVKRCHAWMARIQLVASKRALRILNNCCSTTLLCLMHRWGCAYVYPVEVAPLIHVCRMHMCQETC